MARVKRGVTAHAKHKKVLEQAKGFYGRRKNTIRTAKAAVELASSHGRVHAISPDVAALHSGHGNVMPMSLHGGPGRAGGGEELGGLRALNFYHRRTAVQGSTEALDRLAAQGCKLPL